MNPRGSTPFYQGAEPSLGKVCFYPRSTTLRMAEPGIRAFAPEELRYLLAADLSSNPFMSAEFGEHLDLDIATNPFVGGGWHAKPKPQVLDDEPPTKE